MPTAANNRYTGQVVTQNIQVTISIQIQSGRRGSMHMHKHVVAVTHVWRQCAPVRKESATSLPTCQVKFPMPRNGDIRGWMTPQRMAAPQQVTPSPQQQRRRRIIESDDSNEDLPMPLQAEAARIIAEPLIPPPPQAVPLPAAQAPVIQLSDDSESDDMCIPLPHHIRQQVAPSERPAQPGLQRVSSSAPVPEGRRRAPAEAPPLANNGRNLRRRIEAEAEESELEDDDSSECIESDTNAQQLYHEAILGVRNARNSRIQMRSHTTPCNVCAIFAQYLQHFMHR
jgi:hypothetical protein